MHPDPVSSNRNLLTESPRLGESEKSAGIWVMWGFPNVPTMVVAGKHILHVWLIVV